MTVLENLQMGATVADPAHFADDLARAFAVSDPAQRQAQRGGTLSGGEQQMLAIARALMSRPRLLLLDEPSLGLAPLIVRQIFDVIREINEQQQVTVFLVEQNAHHALRLAHRAYVMQTGRIVLAGAARNFWPTRRCAPPISRAVHDTKLHRHDHPVRRGRRGAGQALARNWRGAAQLVPYALLLAAGERFLLYAL